MPTFLRIVRSFRASVCSLVSLSQVSMVLFLMTLVAAISPAAFASAGVYVGGVQLQIPGTESIPWTGPVGVAVDSTGNIYIAQHTISQIVKIDATTPAVLNGRRNPSSYFLWRGTVLC